jgi:hypothetical protein
MNRAGLHCRRRCETMARVYRWMVTVGFSMIIVGVKGRLMDASGPPKYLASHHRLGDRVDRGVRAHCL